MSLHTKKRLHPNRQFKRHGNSEGRCFISSFPLDCVGQMEYRTLKKQFCAGTPTPLEFPRTCMEGRARVDPKDEEDKTWKTSGERQRRSGKGRSRKGLQGWEESSEATLSAHSLLPHTQGARILIFHLYLGAHLLSLKIWPFQLLLVPEHHQRPFLGLLTHNSRLSNTGSYFIYPLSLSSTASFSLIHSLSLPCSKIWSLQYRSYQYLLHVEKYQP